jgi:hypothetical protein
LLYVTGRRLQGEVKPDELVEEVEGNQPEAARFQRLLERGHQHLTRARRRMVIQRVDDLQPRLTARIDSDARPLPYQSVCERHAGTSLPFQ